MENGWLEAYFLMVDQWFGIHLVNGLVLATEKPSSKHMPYISLYCIYYVQVCFLCIMTSLVALWLYLSKCLKLMYGFGGSVDSPMSSWVLSLCNAGKFCAAWATAISFWVVIKHTLGAAGVVCLYTGGCGDPMQLPG